MAEWIASDPKNWQWGRNVRTLLEDPVFVKVSDTKALFPSLAGSIFPPKDSDEFSSVVSTLSSFSGKTGTDGTTEKVTAKMFLGLLSTAWCVPMGFETTVRFKRLFLLSWEFWEDEQCEKALEFCLCGHFGSEIAAFAAPTIADSVLTSGVAPAAPSAVRTMPMFVM